MRRLLRQLRIRWNRYWDWPMCRYCGQDLYQDEASHGHQICFDCVVLNLSAIHDDHGVFAYPLTPLPVRHDSRAA